MILFPNRMEFRKKYRYNANIALLRYVFHHFVNSLQGQTT